MDELCKLADMLKEANAEYSLKENDFGMWQIILYKDGEKVDDAIYGEGSWGYEDGLLESYKLNNCEGYETAGEIFEGWKRLYL